MARDPVCGTLVDRRLPACSTLAGHVALAGPGTSGPHKSAEGLVAPLKLWRRILLFGLLWATLPCPLQAQMNMGPYFSTISYPLERQSVMLMALPDFQVARYGSNFVTGMLMAEYGITPQWTVGVMAEGQKISGMPVTYGGWRLNTYFHLFKDDKWLNLTLYLEYEDLNGAALYKMEVAGFGPEDLTEPLEIARRTPVRTLEQRAIIYHDWGRLNATFNFIRETALQAPHGDDYGYALGLFFKAPWMSGAMAGMADMPAPPVLSLSRLGYGLEMIGALGDNQRFGFYWGDQQHYLGAVFSYDFSPQWSVRVEPAFGLSNVSDPFMLRMGVAYTFGMHGSKAKEIDHAEPKTEEKMPNM